MTPVNEYRPFESVLKEAALAFEEARPREFVLGTCQILGLAP